MSEDFKSLAPVGSVSSPSSLDDDADSVVFDDRSFLFMCSMSGKPNKNIMYHSKTRYHILQQDLNKSEVIV